ncbi:MAG TPA: hypothetical protein VMW36_10800 [Patescibacteria group bacterium]|nr:hypothetical protein [Patescibacteria group bacterium]
MYNVQKGNVRDDKFLTGLAVKYTNNEFVGGQWLPEYGVQKESDKYRIFRKDGFYKGAPKKADGAITEEATLSYDEGTYSTYERAIKDIVTDRAMQNADAPVRPKIDATQFLTEKVLLSQEIDVWALLLGTSGLEQSGYYEDLTSTTAWISGTEPDILNDLSDAIVTISKAIGKRPNKIGFTTEVSEAIVQDPVIREILKYHTTNMITGNALPSTLRNMQVVIADGLWNSADEGQTAVYEYIMKYRVCIAYVEPGNNLTLGRTFVSKPFKVVRWRDDDREGEFIKVNKVYAPKITSMDAGYMYKRVSTGESADD